MTRRVIIDVSSWQPEYIDFSKLPAEIVGAIIKMSQGDSAGSNPRAGTQYQSARDHGKVTGGYHFDDTRSDPDRSADAFLANMAGKKMELGSWFDFESNWGGLSQSGVRAHNGQIMKRLAAAAPMKAGIYTAPWAWDPQTGYADFSGYPLWLAGYTPSLPPSPAHWGQPLLWQFTDSYPCYWGGAHSCDASVFLGTDEQWNWLVNGTTPTPPKPVPMDVKIKVLEAVVHIPQTGLFSRELDMRLMAIRAMKDDLGRKNPAAVKLAQQVMAFGPKDADGIWGPVTHDSVVVYIKKIQTAMGVSPLSGTWDTATEFSFLVIDPLR